MPRARASSAAPISVEPEKPVEFEEQANLEGDNNMEETVEEEVEYEEVEEEVEEEEAEEEEEVEEEDEAEEEEEEEVENNGDGTSSQKGGDDEKMKDVESEEDVDEKHAKLLALPPHGSEVYIGGFHQDVCEEDLRHFCESIGEVTEVRMMKAKDTNENKRYAFVTFRTVELASRAIEELNNAELKGKKVKCSTSQAKHKLFIGNVPRNWGEEDLRKAVNKIGPGVTSVELVKDPHNSSRNRGFAFIGYYNHACAEYSREKMSNQKFKLDDNAPTVSWADPKNAESSASLQVKAVYVRNLPKDVTQDQLKNLFEHHGKITKVVLPPARKGQEDRRIGFIHFAERSSTMKALKDTEKYELDGHVLECSLAKPQAEQKPSGGPNPQKTTILPAYTPPLGYGLVGAAYGTPGGGYGAAGFGQPLMYGAGPTAAGLAMMPMLLPDGRVGYVLQQPGAQPHTPLPHQRGSRGGGRGSSGRRVSDSGRGRSRYNPY